MLLADDELREDFYEVLCQFGKHVSIAVESEEVYNALRAGELAQYKKDYKFFQELRKAVKLRYSDGIDYKAYEAKMQKLMDTYIAAEEMIRITKPVDILDEKGFEEELQRLGTPRAKADAIRTRMSKSINTKWDENPAYYKTFSQRIEETLEAYKDQRINDFWFPLILIKSAHMRTIPLATALLFGQYRTNFGLVFAALTMASVPIIIFYLLFSKFFTKGLLQGAIKG